MPPDAWCHREKPHELPIRCAAQLQPLAESDTSSASNYKLQAVDIRYV